MTSDPASARHLPKTQDIFRKGVPIRLHPLSAPIHQDWHSYQAWRHPCEAIFWDSLSEDEDSNQWSVDDFTECALLLYVNHFSFEHNLDNAFTSSLVTTSQAPAIACCACRVCRNLNILTYSRSNLLPRA